VWTFIKRDDYPKYLETYPELAEFPSDIILHENEQFYFLPRWFIYNYPSRLLQTYEMRMKPSKFKNIETSIELRDEQQPIVDTVLKVYKKYGNVHGIIKARPGIGKTVIAIYLMVKLGFKTVILVDNDGLMEQWVERILQFTNLTEDNIGYFKARKVQLDKPVILSTVQTAMRRTEGSMYETIQKINNAGVNFVIVDEVHTTSSSVKFAKSSLLFSTKNILGLSATPYHVGLQKILMYNTVGPILYSTNEYELLPKYYVLKYKSDIFSQKSAKRIFAINDFIARKSIYDKHLVKSESYIQTVVDVVKRLIKMEHVVMVLCRTIDQVKLISAELEKVGIKNRRYYGQEREIDKTEDKVLVVTYTFCGKGFDFPALSSLVLATPLMGKKSLIQTIGRILRKSDDKKNPIVVDLVDTDSLSIFPKMMQLKENVIKNEFGIEPEIIESVEEVGGDDG